MAKFLRIVGGTVCATICVVAPVLGMYCYKTFEFLSGPNGETATLTAVCILVYYSARGCGMCIGQQD